MRRSVDMPTRLHQAGMLSDAQWAELEPLTEACRQKGKTPPPELRRTVSTILWRHRNSTKWRDVRSELGPWWRAAQLFIRWARAGIRERLLNLVQERSVPLAMVFLGETRVCALQALNQSRVAGLRAHGET